MPIRCSAFLPLTTERKSIASASLEIWLISPGNIIAGSFVFSFTCFIKGSKLPLNIKLPPMRKASTPDFSQCFTKAGNSSSVILSGSRRMRYAAPFILILSSR